jgi:hypothetical protein
MLTQVPFNVSEIIAHKRQAMLEEQMQKEEAEKRERKDFEMQGQIKFNEYLKASLLNTPEWIHTYIDPTFSDLDFERIGRGYEHAERALFFSIPGLAEIAFNPKTNQWRAQDANWASSWDEKPQLQFTNASYWRSDIELVLTEAQTAQKEYDAYLLQYAERQEERARQAEKDLQDRAEQEARDQVTAIRYELKHQEELREEQVLLDTLQHDPVAMAMLKAFVLIYQERSSFTSQIEDANNSLYSMEECWSRKAADLRRQADDADRKAEDERSRLQGDLDDAEARLKKATRGW